MAVKTVGIKVVLLSVAVLVAVEGLAAMMARGPVAPFAALGLARILEIFLILGIVSFWGRGISGLGLGLTQIASGLKKGLIWSALFGSAAFLGVVALYAVHMSPWAFIKTPLPNGTQALVWFFVVGGLVAPIAEEIFFRGIIYGFLRRWGVVVAVIGATAVFVAAHGVFSRVPMTQIVGGVVFALAYETGGSLMVPMTIHVLGNTAIFALSLVLA